MGLTRQDESRRPLIDHPPLLQHHDEVGLGGQGQAVSGANDRAPAREPAHGGRDGGLGRQVERAGRLIERTVAGVILSNARARATRWRWPPESRPPLSPTSVA